MTEDAQASPSQEPTAGGLPRLPPGRHGLPREFVVQNQRDRLAAGIISAVSENGYHDTTISQIAAAAGVSRRTFYTYFDSKEACFIATYDQILDHLRSTTIEAASSQGDWPQQIVARFASTLETYAANPQLAQFMLATPPRAGGEIDAHHRAVLDRAASEIAESAPPSAERPSEAVLQSLIGGVIAIIVGKAEAGEGDRMQEILPDLVELILAPFIGRAEAVRVAQVASKAG